MTRRRERVAHDLRSRLAEVLIQNVRDPRLELVTLTDVEVSPDLSFARVFYRTIGDPEGTERALERAKPFIRRRLAEGLTLRRVPELAFRLDETPERAARVEEILDQLEEERQAPEAPTESGAVRQGELASPLGRKEQS
jgi:ribosome-binding factor A